MHKDLLDSFDLHEELTATFNHTVDEPFLTLSYRGHSVDVPFSNILFMKINYEDQSIFDLRFYVSQSCQIHSDLTQQLNRHLPDFQAKEIGDKVFYNMDSFQYESYCDIHIMNLDDIVENNMPKTIHPSLLCISIDEHKFNHSSLFTYINFDYVDHFYIMKTEKVKYKYHLDDKKDEGVYVNDKTIKPVDSNVFFVMNKEYGMNDLPISSMKNIDATILKCQNWMLNNKASNFHCALRTESLVDFILNKAKYIK